MESAVPANGRKVIAQPIERRRRAIQMGLRVESHETLVGVDGPSRVLDCFGVTDAIA